MRYRILSSHADYAHAGNIAYPGQPSLIGGGSYQIYGPILSIEDAEIAARLMNDASKSTGNPSTSFNPYDIGVASYLSNVWETALTKAKQTNTTPKITKYESAPLTATFGLQNIFGLVQGIPEYLKNIREKDAIEWEAWKADHTKLDMETKNIENQEVITDVDLKNDPNVVDNDKPSTWDEFVRGVKEGWNAEKEAGLLDIVLQNPALTVTVIAGIVIFIAIVK